MRGKPGWFSLIAGRFARGCSLSGISMGSIEKKSVLAALGLVGDKVMAGETPANPATLVNGDDLGFRMVEG